MAPRATPNAVPDLATFSEPSARSYIVWTPSLVRAAEISADGGNLRLAADLCESMFADDRVTATHETLADGLLGLDLDFEAGTGRRKQRAVKALEAEEDFFAAYSEAELKKLIRWGRCLGIGVAEQKWTPRSELYGHANQPSRIAGGDDRLIPVLEVKSPRFLRYDWIRHSWMLMVVEGATTQGADAFAQAGAQREIPITPGDGKWIMYMPYGITRPWAFGTWRALSRWWLLKMYAMQDFGAHGEMARGARRVVAPKGTTFANRQQLAAEVDSLASSGTIVVPEGVDLSIISMTATTHQVYTAQIEAADKGMGIAVLGNNLTTEVGGKSGSNAAAKTHVEDVTGARIRSTGKTLATCLHDQSLTWWAEYNFGDRLIAPWPDWDTDPPEDLNTKAQTYLVMSQALAALEAEGIDTDPILEEFGLKRADPTKLAPSPNGGPAPTPPSNTPDSMAGRVSPTSPSGSQETPSTPSDTAQAVWEQLKDDYPNDAIAWVLDADWEGPTNLDVDSIDTSARDTWTASRDPERVKKFADDINDGADVKPIVAVKRPGSDKLIVVDGHHRTLASEQAGKPVPAYVATVDSATGPWDEMHASQIRAPSTVTAKRVRLASRAKPSTRRGFVRGQLYADSVTDAAVELARQAMRDDVDAVLAAIEHGSSYADARKRLLRAYKAMAPKNLAEDVVHPAITMTKMAGRASAVEDTSK